MKHRKIILASGSKNRQDVMKALGVEFEAIPADIDEKLIRDEDFGIRAEKIARAKAEKIRSLYPEAIIIAGDSFGTGNGKVFEKPANKEEARQMLADESGIAGRHFAGFCYMDPEKKIDYSTVVVTEFEIRKLTEQEIEGYVGKFPVLNWCGALFAGHEYGASAIKSVNGSLNAIIYGFPTELVVEYLQRSGVEIRP